MEPFKFQVTHNPGVTILRLQGTMGVRLDDLSIAMNAIAARRSPLTVVDITGLTMLASIGMGLFVNLRRGLAMHNCVLKLAGPSPLILDSLRRARLTTLFEITNTVEEALAGVADAQ